MGAKVLKAINIDLPEWMVAELDAEAEKLGINRKAVINVLLASVLEERRRFGMTDVGYRRAVESSLAQEWDSEDDDEAFRDL